MPWKLIPSVFHDSQKSNAHVAGPTHQESGTPAQNSGRSGADETVFIARQPVFDATERVVGYELLFRPSGLLPERVAGSISDGANLLVNTLNRFGVAQALGEKTGFLRLDKDTLSSDLIELLPKERFVLEYPSGFLNTPEQAARCASLQTQGFQLARTCQPGDCDLNDAATAKFIVYDLALQPLQDIVRLDRAA